MLADSFERDLNEDQLALYREKAKKLLEEGKLDQAAQAYRCCARLQEDLGTLEASTKVKTRRREAAKEYRDVADTLEDADSLEDLEPETPEVRTNNEPPARERDEDAPLVDASILQDSPDLSFEDVGGMEHLKQILADKVIDPYERKDLYAEYGLGPINGLILYGPPGTGKTYLTQALAGELGWNYVEVTAASIVSKYVGESAKHMQDLFATAKENQPCLLFFDEIDSLASEREDTHGSQSQHQMLTQFLQELSAVSEEDIVVVGATNHLRMVDRALQNPDRFPEVIEVPPPDADAREAILRVHFRNRPLLRDELDWAKIREETEGFSASDLKMLANEAARQAVQQASRTDTLEPITDAHLEAALDQTEASLERIEFESMTKHGGR